MKSVAERIKAARKEKSCTVKELADACGITESAVQMYECGQRVPRDDVKVLMADFLGKPVQDLFF